MENKTNDENIFNETLLENVKYFSCDECSKNYKKKGSLKRHIYSKHRLDVFKERKLKLKNLKLINQNLQVQANLLEDQINFMRFLLSHQHLHYHNINHHQHHPHNINHHPLI